MMSPWFSDELRRIKKNCSKLRLTVANWFGELRWIVVNCSELRWIVVIWGLFAAMVPLPPPSPFPATISHHQSLHLCHCPTHWVSGLSCLQLLAAIDYNNYCCHANVVPRIYRCMLGLANPSSGDAQGPRREELLSFGVCVSYYHTILENWGACVLLLA